MEMTSLVVGLLKPLLWLLPVVVLAGILKSPWFKGWWGEYQVRTLIRRRLSLEVYREFHNVTIRDEFGETTQIDHVYVCLQVGDRVHRRLHLQDGDAGRGLHALGP